MARPPRDQRTLTGRCGPESRSLFRAERRVRSTPGGPRRVCACATRRGRPSGAHPTARLLNRLRHARPPQPRHRGHARELISVDTIASRHLRPARRSADRARTHLSSTPHALHLARSSTRTRQPVVLRVDGPLREFLRPLAPPLLPHRALHDASGEDRDGRIEYANRRPLRIEKRGRAAARTRRAPARILSDSG